MDETAPGVLDRTDDDPFRDRHPGVRHLMRLLTPNPNLPQHLQTISREVYELAGAMVWRLPDDPELTAALRKLLEAKDCLVRAAL